MGIAARAAGRTADTHQAGRPWSMVRSWLPRAPHHNRVHNFLAAAERSDEELLAAMLDPRVSVVVDGGEGGSAKTRVFTGIKDAVSLITYTMARRSDVMIEELPINGQAGLMLSRASEAIAAINIDFTGGLVSLVWIRLHPQQLRRGNRV